MNSLDFTDKELRDISNFESIYERYVDNERMLFGIPYCMYEKLVKNKSYLYLQKDSDSSPTSLGVLNEENMLKLKKYKEEKEYLNNMADSLAESVMDAIKYFKLSKANRVDSKVARILRELDKHEALGKDVLVVGTNAFVAYEIHAQSLMFPENMATDDFDLTWYRNTFDIQNQNDEKKPVKIIKILQSIDKSYILNYKKPYQAINSAGYEVELLAAPSVVNKQTNIGGFKPIPLMEQEWLLQGKPIRHILLSNDLKPAPIVAPDPRWMALHKIWLSKKPERNKLKVTKDFKQGDRLLSLVIEKMQYEYPIDSCFISLLSNDLKNILDKYTVGKKIRPF